MPRSASPARAAASPPVANPVRLGRRRTLTTAAVAALSTGQVAALTSKERWAQGKAKEWKIDVPPAERPFSTLQITPVGCKLLSDAGRAEPGHDLRLRSERSPVGARSSASFSAVSSHSVGSVRSVKLRFDPSNGDPPFCRRPNLRTGWGARYIGGEAWEVCRQAAGGGGAVHEVGVRTISQQPTAAQGY